VSDEGALIDFRTRWRIDPHEDSSFESCAGGDGFEDTRLLDRITAGPVMPREVDPSAQGELDAAPLAPPMTAASAATGAARRAG